MITQKQLDTRDVYIKVLEQQLGVTETAMLNLCAGMHNTQLYIEAISEADKEAGQL